MLHSFPRGNKNEIAKMHWQNLKNNHKIIIIIKFKKNQQDLAQSILGWWWFMFLKLKRYALFQGIMNTTFKILLLENHWANFYQTWHKAPLVKAIQICSNEEPHLFQKKKEAQNHTAHLEQQGLKIKKLELIHEICNTNLWQIHVTMKNNYLLIQSRMAMNLHKFYIKFVKFSSWFYVINFKEEDFK